MNIRSLYPSYTMHKILFVAIALLGVSAITVAQTNVAIAPTKLNVLYIGVDNPVSIAASNAADAKITVTISGGDGSISKISSGLYNVHVSSVTDECMINVYVDSKLAGTSTFRVRKLPVPEATIANLKSGSNIPADVFRKQGGVGIVLEGFPFEVNYNIVSFSLTMDTEEGNIVAADCSGALFSSFAKQAIERNIKPGRTVTVDNIRVADPAGTVKHLPSLVYYIK